MGIRECKSWHYIVAFIFVVGVGRVSSGMKVSVRPLARSHSGGDARRDVLSNPPKISLVSSHYFGDVAYREAVPASPVASLQFQNETVYVAPSSRNNLMFECTANYPLRWHFAHSQIDYTVYHSVRVMSTRKFTDPFDPATFTYTSLLSLDGPTGKLTGNYSCQSTARNYVQSSILVFWESYFGSRLVNNNENLTVTISSLDEGIRLPCQVTDPHSRPTLHKLLAADKDSYEDLRLNESIVYSPALGYTLKSLPNPLGTYKCLLDATEFVFVRVVQRKVRKSYTFSYDDAAKQVKCCLSRANNGTGNGVRRAPKLFLMDCQHPSTCMLREQISTDSIRHIWNQGGRRGDCAVLNLRNSHSGVVRCIGAGYSASKQFIVPLQVKQFSWNQKRNSTTYFHWNEINPNEMVAVSVSTEKPQLQDEFGWSLAHTDQDTSKNVVIYANQIISVACHTSRYYFASGMYWMFRWKNKTLTSTSGEMAQREAKDFHLFDRDRHLNMLSFTAHIDMEAAICFAPVWNSSVWIPKIQYLYVNESAPPVIEGSLEIVNYTWYANETGKILTCSASGLPAPTFQWIKDNVTILPTAHNYNVVTPNVTQPSAVATNSTPHGAGGENTSSVPDDGSGSKGDDANGRDNTARQVGATSHTSVLISRVSYSTSGVFRCVSTNVAGQATKEFRITVLEAKSWKLTALLVGATVTTFVLIAGIIYLLKRFYQDRREISQLAATSSISRSSSVNFSDVMSSGNEGTAGARHTRGFGGEAVSSHQLGWDDCPPTNHSIRYETPGFPRNNLIDTF